MHNLIRDENEEFFSNHRSDSEMNTNDQNSQEQSTDVDLLENEPTQHLRSAIEARNTFVEYFSTVGKLAWRNQ